MTEDLESLKSNPGVLRIYGNYTKLKKEGDRFVGICPLHSEKSGSFTVFKDLKWTCFGGCGSSDIIGLVQKVDNVGFKEAVAKVRDQLGESKWDKQREVVEQTFRSVAEPTKQYRTFPLSEYSKYIENLKNSKPAREWLAGRGITLETALRLKTGFRQDIGKLAGDKHQEHAATGWICFPCVQGDTVTSIKYRSIVEKAFSKQPGMATELYNTDTVDMFEDVLLVEGECDALVLEQAGFRAVSLASASSHPTPAQKDQLMRASRVFLAGDSDGAVGEAIMSKLWRELEERTYFVKWPDGLKDANEVFLTKCGGDVPSFRTEVEKLLAQAATTPMPDVYSLKEVMMSSQQGSLTDHPRRFRWPQPEVDKMAILLPGSVWGLYATNTGMGKTQLSLQATMHNALHYGARVLNWQCELTPEEISTIVTAQLLKKDRNTLTSEDKKEAASMLGDVAYYVGHNPGVETADEVLDLIEAAIRRLSITHVVLDTFNNIVVSENNGTAVETKAANRIKNICMKHGVIWGNIFQPRKASQQSRGKKTHITDIRGAGAAADTCDAVYALHRELNKGDGDVPADDIYENRALVQAQKTRAKGTGKAEAYCQFFGAWALFEQIDYSHEAPE